MKSFTHSLLLTLLFWMALRVPFTLAQTSPTEQTQKKSEEQDAPDSDHSDQSDQSEDKDQTFLLDESLISAEQLDPNQSHGGGPIAGPALSTTLRWEGEALSELDIPKEILDHLTQADGFLSNAFRGDDDDFDDDFEDELD